MNTTHPSANADAVPQRRRRNRPGNQRELAQAVFAEVDPITVARGLLNSESEAVRIRTLEILANWAFGSPAATGESSRAAVRILWNVPRPAREATAWAQLAHPQPDPPAEPTEES